LSLTFSEKPMKAKLLVYALPALILTTIHLADAQQPKKIPRIGYLTGVGSGPNEAFLQGLRDLGYVEGKNILIEFRTTGGKFERLPELAAELVQLRVDVIVADTAGEVTAAKNATATIPIVMRGVSDPIALGLVASLAHPGGNITGMAVLAPELSGKRLELLKEVIPKLSRVALLTTPGKAWRTSIKETEVAAQALGLQLQILQVREVDELEGVFDAAKTQRAGALVQVQATSLGPYQPRIIELAAKNRLPIMYSNRRSVEIGGLMSYGQDNLHLNRRVASMVDKILKGRKPADIPVEQPMKFEFAVNLKTAKQLGLTIPPNVLARADKVLK
jgi:putative tryptophan/tyrosine transport system substrate-binding protein